jgi:hypothetical protein
MPFGDTETDPNHRNPARPDVAHGGPMSRMIVFTMMLLLLPAAALHAQDKKRDAAKDGSDAKALSGISIVGNNEAPKSLYIVPWKASELGGDNGLNPSLLDARNAPVDKEVFMREVSYYELSNPQ